MSMKNLISNAVSFYKNLHLERLFAVVLIGFLVLVTNTNIDPGSNNKSLPKELREEIQEANQKSERPKTTGEFKEEAGGDVPLNERIFNITRDSAESLKEMGKDFPTISNEDAVK